MTSAPPPSPPNSPEDSAQRDVERLNRTYSLSFLLKLLTLLLMLFIIVCIIFYAMAGTSRGTKFLLERIISETGVEAQYGEGNLRDGLLIKDIKLDVTDNINIHFRDTYVKIGWRALFVKEVHFRDADIGRIDIVNKEPSKGQPFDYKRLELPINLRFDNANINKITYNQTGKDQVVVTDVNAADLSWIGTLLEVGEANLQYSDVVNIAGLTGDIKFEDHYPLDLDATVTVNSLEKVYVDPFEVQATGSLKRTYGVVKGKYNNSDVKGQFTVQGLDENSPFDAKLTWQEATLPYAQEQDITLRQGLVIASGVLSDIDIRLRSRLLAKDIPSGDYKVRARVIDKEMHIERLQADTPEGQAIVQGILNWQEDFNAKLLASGRDFDIRALLPESAAPYAPEQLDGQLAFILNTKNSDGLMQINADLQQRDGEHIKAKIVQGKEPNNPRIQTPWLIDASWKNLRRKDVPNIGVINSPNGSANVTVRGGNVWVNANGRITELNVAPAGNYNVKVSKVNNKVVIRSLDYNGVMGDLQGNGSVLLATKNKPLSWQVDAKTNGLLPQAFNESLPVNQLVGSIDAKGVLIDISENRNGKRVKGQRHNFTINAANLNATLTNEVAVTNDSKSVDATKQMQNRVVKVIGSGDGTVDIFEGDIKQFDTRFDGKLDTQGVPKGNFKVDVNGTPKNINIKSFKHDGEAGDLTASGKVVLNNGVTWDIKANTQNLDIGFFAPQTKGMVSGDLVTSGQWQNRSSNNKPQKGILKDFDVKFNGNVDTPKLPKGKLIIEAGGDAQTIKVRKLSHVGDAGSLSAKGSFDVSSGISWNIDAVMDGFNVGYFIEDMPSSLSGRVVSKGNWRDTIQRIDVSELTLKGSLKDQPIEAKGSLSTVMHLPNDISAYLEVLKAADSNAQVSKVKSIIEVLQADDLLLRWGNNQIIANGDAKRLEAKVDISNLQQLSSNITGKLVGGLTLVQADNQPLPTIYVDLQGETITLPNLVLTQGQIKGKIADFGKTESRLLVQADGLQAANTKFSDIKVVFEGTEKKHTVLLNGYTASQFSDFGIEAAIKGGFDRNAKRWSGVVGKGKIATDYVSLKQNQPAEILANFANETAQVQVAAHCWQATDQTGQLCLRDKLIASAKKGQVNVTLQQLDTSLFAPFMPDDLSWQAKLNGKAMVGWQQGSSPSINATLYSDNGKVGLIQGESRPIALPYKRVSLIVESFDKGLKLRTDIDGGTGARGYADIVVDPFKDAKPISGDLVLNQFSLALVKPFFPGLRVLEGDITMAGELAGTLSKPVFYGDAKLKNANLAMIDLPINLEKINANLKVDGQNASVDGTFMSGEGQGSINGSIDWQQTLQAKLRIKGERLVLTQPPLLFAEVSPDVNVIVKPQQKYVNIVGAVTVPTATIRPPEANEEVITKSEDVVVLDRRLIGNIEDVLAITQPWSINADVGVDLGDDVVFRGFGTVLPLAGAINVTQRGQGVMNARGVVQVSRRSDVDIFGQNLELNYAQVRFNGEVINPRLSIEAIKEIKGQTVGVRVKGNVSEPNIVVFNDAGLTQQQAMNALVTGRISNPGATQISEEGFKSEVTNNLAAAGLSLGLSGTRNLTNSIGKALGLQRLTIDASGNADDAEVNLTGYITPDLYIRYGVGVFNAETSLSLRYQLTNRIYVEATSAAESAIDFVYSFQF